MNPMNASEPREDAVAVLRKAAVALGLVVGDVLSTHPRASTYPDGPCLETDSRDELQFALAELDAAIAALAQQGAEPVAWQRAVDEADAAELFSDGLSGDLHSAGIDTIEAAYMEGRKNVIQEIRDLAREKAATGASGDAVARMIDCGDGMGTPKVEWLSPGYRPPVGAYLYAAPQADQQGVEYDRELIADMLSEKVYDDGYGMKSHGAYTVEAIAEQMRLLREADNRDAAGVHTACKPSDQQGASLEGEAVVWVQLEDGKPVALSFTRNEAAGCTTPFTASKASPDDQRQEGVALPPRRQTSDYIADTYGPADLAAIWNACRSETSRLNSASPPTEAAASDVIDFKARAGREAFQRHPFTLPGSVPVAGTFDEIERELRDIGAGNEPMTWDYLHARMNALADQLAALSPTASAAREG